MTTYTNPFTGQTINPTQTSYQSLTISSNTVLTWPINGTTTTTVAANIVEVTAIGAGLKLLMPPATQVSVGQAIIIRNVGSGGSFAFTIADNSGNTIVSVPLSASGANSNTYYIYLTNNLTVNGAWSSIAMGIGTSSATAGALAGNGLIALGNTLNENTPVISFSLSYTFVFTDRATLYTWNGGSGTATLPSPALVGAGWFVPIKNNGTGTLTVSAVGTGYSSVIDPTNNSSGAGGLSSVQIQIGNSSVFVTDGVHWYSYALAQNNTFNYTQLSILTTSLTSPYLLSSANAKSVIQTYSGTLTANLLVLVPPTVQIYSFLNSVGTGGGAYSLSFGVSNSTGTAAAGTTVTAPNNQAVLAISDGTNMYNANSASLGTVSSVLLGNGSSASPSLAWQNDSSSGFYSPGSGQIGFAIGGTSVGVLTATGLRLTAGINGGSF
jgi:hypothetical protein